MFDIEAEGDMKEIIEKLLTLNTVDSRLQVVRKDLERIPTEQAVKEAGPLQLKEQMARNQVQVRHHREEAETLETELKAGGEALRKYSSQMSVIKTSREMEAVRRQIETQKLFNKSTERTVLEHMEKVEELELENQKLKAQLEQLDQAVAADRAKAEKEVAELERDKNELEGQRAKLAQEIPEKELRIYDRIVMGRGQAIARVQGGFCSACFIQLPPQIQHLALLGKDLTTCPSCNRILTP